MLEVQREIQLEVEREPVRFFMTQLEPRLDATREALGAFIGADPADLAFVSNATAGVNAVLRSLSFARGDEILVTSHGYAACRNTLEYVAEIAGAKVVVVPLPLPIESPSQVTEAIVAGVTEKTVLAMVDHITSPTGLVFPIADIVRRLSEAGVDTLVDGAHAAGQVELDVEAIGAAYYTGNCHKWLCTPKGAAFLHVRRDRQIGIRPTVISHGATDSREERSRFNVEFDWVGTQDWTAVLCIGPCIEYLGNGVVGGWDALRARNRDLALQSRRQMIDAVGLEPVGPEEMMGTLAAFRLPGEPDPGTNAMAIDPLQAELIAQFGIQVPVFNWNDPPARLIRYSVQLYNEADDYARLAHALGQLLG